MFQNEDEFRKLIEQVKIEYPSNTAHELEIRNQALRAFEKSSPTMLKIKLKRAWELIMNSRITRYAAVIIILLAASYTIGVLNDGPSTAAKTDNVACANHGGVGVKDVTPEFLKKFNEIKSLYAADDIKALTGLLESDDMAMRVIAAEFLGKTCDAQAALILENLSGEQISTQLAEKFKEAAANIRGNIEAEKQGDSVENKGMLGVGDVNGVSMIAPEPEEGFFLIKVVDKETKKPIRNLNICVQIDGESEYYKTENDWFCKVKLTKPKFGYFSVGLQADGYASVRFVKDIDNPDYVVPLEYTIEIEKGVYIGGYVENEKGERLIGCKVKIKCERKNTAIDRAYADTEAYVDANGLWKCNAVPAKFDYLKLTGDHSDYVGIENAIGSGSEDHKLASELKYVVEVEKGIPIGGVVKNEEGEVVGGADVEIRCLRMEENGAYNTIAKGAAVTDGNGYWKFGKVPDDEQIKQIEVKVIHSDYVQSRDWVEINSTKFELLEAKKFNTVVKRGDVIEGVVTDVDGKAIEGATVIFGAERQSIGVNFFKITTDSAGRFLNDKIKVNEYNMHNIQPGQVAVTVVKSGYAPEMMLVRPKTQKEPLQISLEDGYTIAGRVVDVNGEPVAGVWVFADGWRGFRAIEWRGETDSDGRFKWDGAPADEVKFDFGKKGYSYNRDEALVSSEKEYEIILYPPLKIRGRVVDAETGEAIKNFDITYGIDWQNAVDHISFQKYTKKSISDPNGNYEWEIVDDYPGHVLKVEADGYINSVSKTFKIEEGVGNYDFKLSKADVSEITVKLPDGSPAANAEVIVAPGGESIFFEDGFFRNNNGDTVVLNTDADGKFSLSNRPENFGLVINHEKGFLNIPGEEFEGLKEITLQKWGTIRGYVYKGDSPVAEQHISVYCNQMNNSDNNITPRIDYGLTAVTDANGFFEVKKVIPAKRVQCSWVKKSGQKTNNIMTQFVDVLPGEVSEVEFLMQGRAITGRLIIADSTGDRINYQQSWLAVYFAGLNGQDGMSQVYREVISRYLPDGFDKMTVAERMNWADDFQKSGDVKQLQKEIEEYSKKTDVIETRQGVVLSDDGTFFIEGLSGGKWMIKGNLAELNKDSSNQRYKYIPVNFEIEVPEVDGLYDDKVLDVGGIDIILEKPEKKLTGKICPGFSGETADGKKVGLTDYRGIYLILNVSAFGNLTREMVEQLKGLKEQYSAEEFQILTLAYEAGYSAIVKLGEEIQIDWPVVYVRMPESALTDYNVFDIFGMFGLDYQTPSMNFIVSPEGEILKASAAFSEISNALEKVFVSP